jgi:hypothetical protein
MMRRISDDALVLTKMADYAFGSNPPYELRASVTSRRTARNSDANFPWLRRRAEIGFRGLLLNDLGRTLELALVADA